MTAMHPGGAGGQFIDLAESAEDQRAILVLAGAHFDVAPEAVGASAVSWYTDDSSVFASYWCPRSRVARLPHGRASRIDLTLSRATRYAGGDLDAVRAEYDHPAVRVVPVTAPGWSLAYTVLAGVGAGAAGGTMMRFVQAEPGGSITVSLDAGGGPLDHEAAVRLAAGVKEAVRFEQRLGRAAAGEGISGVAGG